jgi:hypothetical protein
MTAALAHSLLAALSLVACAVMRRREGRALDAAAWERESAVLALTEARRVREQFSTLARRALDLEASISRVNQRNLDATGTVTDAGAMLACAVLQLRVDIDEVQRGRDGQ